ncbi:MULTISPECIES: hypothetical protein [Staphylococcus]|jgi:uncharacterized membrane protein|uniref:Uncharacterized protein n=1 Tax=Staphylococcus nepalensis TaxID=214473 RepID=A0ABS3L205_9STAP|nr:MULTISPECIES: hypothetical protein [Staphylococcus]MBO1205968.1 hypothetical protein [Staphylococcus nepalensis]MBO1214643.1 hypothetical protein [Staphylococcus nepalensis]MBO1216675.1 hypothetical protein [Staphylococcus nepalensis]MBO1227581.1 hypothetical protein [Staphylococcus nepalensis]MBO1235659.1 hypothetical protein [Staphylococcus nepalensis]
MLTKGIKHRRVKLLFDFIGILSAIGVLIIVFINSYVGNHSGNFKLGFDVYGTDMIIMNIFLLITVVCAVMSIILKSIK